MREGTTLSARKEGGWGSGSRWERTAAPGVFVNVDTFGVCWKNYSPFKKRHMSTCT